MCVASFGRRYRVGWRYLCHLVGPEGLEPSRTTPSTWRLCRLPTAPWINRVPLPFGLRLPGARGGDRTHDLRCFTPTRNQLRLTSEVDRGGVEPPVPEGRWFTATYRAVRTDPWIVLAERRGLEPHALRHRSASNRGGEPASPYPFLGGERRSRTPSPCGLTRFRDGGRYQHRLHSPRRMAASVSGLPQQDEDELR